MLQELNLLLQREVEIQNQHLYGDNLRRSGTYDEGYHEGKRDAYLAVWQLLNGVINVSERLAEVEELLITLQPEWEHPQVNTQK